MNEDVIKGSFTRYVEKALKRSKRDYVKKQQRRERQKWNRCILKRRQGRKWRRHW